MAVSRRIRLSPQNFLCERRVNRIKSCEPRQVVTDDNLEEFLLGIFEKLKEMGSLLDRMATTFAFVDVPSDDVRILCRISSAVLAAESQCLSSGRPLTSLDSLLHQSFFFLLKEGAGAPFTVCHALF